MSFSPLLPFGVRGTDIVPCGRCAGLAFFAALPVKYYSTLPHTRAHMHGHAEQPRRAIVVLEQSQSKTRTLLDIADVVLGACDGTWSGPPHSTIYL